MGPQSEPGRCRRRAVLAVALLTAAVCVAGPREQERTAALIIYVDGEEFSVVDAAKAEVPVDWGDAIGFELVEGDTVVTENGTFLELQLVPSENVVKVAENTNFTIERREGERGGTFSLVYGSVRARVRLLTETDRFSIHSASAIAGVRGTDFGVTVALPKPASETGAPGAGALGASALAAGALAAGAIGQPPPAPGEPEAAAPEARRPEATGPQAALPALVTQVYCFEGVIEVTPQLPAPVPEPGEAEVREEGEAPTPEPVIVRANESVSVSPVVEPSLITVEPISQEVREYWRENDFRATPVPAPELPVPAAVQPAPAPAEEPRAATKRVEKTPEPAPAPSVAAAPGAPAAEAARERPVPTPALDSAKEQLLRQIRQSRDHSRAAGLLLFPVGLAMTAAGMVDYLTPAQSFFGDGGMGIMGTGAAFLVAGALANLRAAGLERRLKELESGD